MATFAMSCKLPMATNRPSDKLLVQSRVKSTVAASRASRTFAVRASNLKYASTEADQVSFKENLEDDVPKVFADEMKGIVCYQTETGEIVCEGMDEGPQFYPPCSSNFYMPGTRAAAILPLLGEVMYEI
ncbi:hypothetical protein KP509_23G074200 [Ceratopteris richardii]|uniref:Uncharacterized protein n=1 Tax=Ceratopteris richardii TaxID=49495 RepID=A0A8T2S2Z5_CERRI|nr:hypothetical protein KP509_23G074200 [Ceratopteris richardii]